jgi:hypothetical protein
MSFFDQFINQQSNDRVVDPTRTITIFINGGEQISITAEQAAGKTVAQLFNEHASALGINSSRITSFTAAGTLVPGETRALPGHSYMGAAATENKG